MAGSKRERKPGVWELRVSLGRRDSQGRPAYKSETFRGGARDADKRLRKLVEEVESGVDVAAGKRTLSDLLTAWLDTYGRDLAPATKKRYRVIIRRQIEPALGAVRVDKLTTPDLKRFYNRLLDDGLSEATVIQTHAIIRRALTVACDEWSWISANPAAKSGLRPKRTKRTEVEVPRTEWVVRLLDEAERYSLPVAVFLWVAATTGARRGELCALRWSDLDLDGGTVTIREAVSANDDPDGPSLVLKDTKTHAVRTLRIDAATVELLRRYHERMTERAVAAGGELPSTAFVFSGGLFGETPYHPDSISTAFERIRDRAGLPKFRLHSLRHWMITTALVAGEDVRTVAGRAGHENPTMTLKVYGHFVEAADMRVADTLGAALAPKAIESGKEDAA